MTVKATYFVSAVFFIFVGIAIGYGAGSEYGADKPTAQFQETIVAAPPDRPLPGVRINYVGSGVFEVPKEFAPGTYMVTAPGSTFGCYWARLKSPSDKTSAIIYGNTVTRGGLSQFTVTSTDKAVKMVGDCTWSKLGN